MKAKYRQALPQTGERLFLSDGGIETTLIFHQGIDLPHFAAIVLMRSEAGREALAHSQSSFTSGSRATSGR